MYSVNSIPKYPKKVSMSRLCFPCRSTPKNTRMIRATSPSPLIPSIRTMATSGSFALTKPSYHRHCTQLRKGNASIDQIWRRLLLHNLLWCLNICLRRLARGCCSLTTFPGLLTDGVAASSSRPPSSSSPPMFIELADEGAYSRMTFHELNWSRRACTAAC